jgi:hypothetical protein
VGAAHGRGAPVVPAAGPLTATTAAIPPSRRPYSPAWRTTTDAPMENPAWPPGVPELPRPGDHRLQVEHLQVADVLTPPDRPWPRKSKLTTPPISGSTVRPSRMCCLFRTYGLWCADRTGRARGPGSRTTGRDAAHRAAAPRAGEAVGHHDGEVAPARAGGSWLASIATPSSVRRVVVCGSPTTAVTRTTTSVKCSTTGGAAKYGPMWPRHCGNRSVLRKFSRCASTESHSTSSTNRDGTRCPGSSGRSGSRAWSPRARGPWRRRRRTRLPAPDERRSARPRAP